MQPEKRKYTSDEFLAMYDLEGRYELVSGEIYAMSPSPNEIHQDISGGLYSEIRYYIRKHSGKCKAFVAPFDVKLDDRNTVQPDVFVVCDRSKLDGKKCNGAPDWVIEILSPSNIKRDAAEKLSLYAETGVREYWIVDPMAGRVFVYPFDNGEISSIGIFTFDDKITVGIYKDAPEPLTICINDLL